MPPMGPNGPPYRLPKGPLKGPQRGLPMAPHNQKQCQNQLNFVWKEVDLMKISICALIDAHHLAMASTCLQDVVLVEKIIDKFIFGWWYFT